MVNALVADDNLHVHQLVHDLLEINFKKVRIDQALTGDSFKDKIEEALTPYDLIIFNLRLDDGAGEAILPKLQDARPEIFDRMILLADSSDQTIDPRWRSIPLITKPFSLDYFNEMVKKVCVR